MPLMHRTTILQAKERCSTGREVFAEYWPRSKIADDLKDFRGQACSLMNQEIGVRLVGEVEYRKEGRIASLRGPATRKGSEDCN